MTDQRSEESIGRTEPQHERPLVVGIGASAGGIHALQAFFEHVPADSGAAYVVILHLSPDHDSQLAAVLQPASHLPVTQVFERVRIEINHVYVIPPDKHLSMSEGHLLVEPNLTSAERRAPVDIFFRSLAETQGSRAVCVVLSGTGANGSMGLKRVKELGGAAFVQDPQEAEFDEMPRNSIATNLVDEILPASEIPQRIVHYGKAVGTLDIPVRPDEHKPSDQVALRGIFVQLHARTGHDFSNYKRPTLLRRIERRIHVHDLPDLSSYATYVHDNPGETKALLKDILISVTNFFRDRDAFDAIENEIVPQLVDGKSGDDQLRMWVIGCATGEEAYSLAMLCAEQTFGVLDAPKIQIFATDIDREALQFAREGLYTLNDTADVSPERMRRFFMKERDGFRVRREIREMVLFANHNVLKDPPFSHVDLVSCRNVMIYLESAAQDRVLETAHFALNPGGYLFLGTSESVGDASDLYATVGRHKHLFQAQAVTARRYPLADRMADFALRARSPVTHQEDPRRETARATFGELHHALLESYAPPSVLINQDQDVVHVSPRAGRYLLHRGGEPSSNVLQLIRPELRLELRTALTQAAARGSSVEVDGVLVKIEGIDERIRLHVRPVTSPTDTARGFMLVLFEATHADAGADEPVFRSDEPIAHQLEEELVRLKQEIRHNSEAHDIQAEELKASNEELQAMNEELRSAAEELETSREELQSINEELTMVNQELSIKVEELSQSSNNLRNLVNSTNIATIFLDRAGRVQLFSPAVRDIFNLQSADVGRPLTDITSKLIDVDLFADSVQVLDTLVSIEREVRTSEARIFLMRVLPYRTSDERIQGIVATFTDITERKTAEDAIAADLRDTQLLRELGVRLIQHGDFQPLAQEIVAVAVRLSGADGGALQICDSASDRLVMVSSQGLSDAMIATFDRIAAHPGTSCAQALKTGAQAFVDYSEPGVPDIDGIVAARQREGFESAQSTPLLARSGRMLGMLSTYWRTATRPTERDLRFIDLLARQAADFLEQRESAEALMRSEQRLQTIANLVPDLLWSTGPDGNADWFNQPWFDYTGQAPAAAMGHGWLDAIHPEDRDRALKGFDASIDGSRSLKLQYRMKNAAGEDRWFLAHARQLRDEGGVVVRSFGAATDIHEQKIAHDALRGSEERLRLTFESVVDYAIFTSNSDGIIDSWNVGAQRMFGYTEQEALGQHMALIFTPEDRAVGAHLEEMRTARETGRAADERWHLRKSGQRFYVSGVLTLLLDEGRLRGYAKVARDLTQAKSATDALKQAHEQLETKVEERTRSLANVNSALREEIGEREKAERERLDLLRQLVNAQEEERRRISRELHDQLGQEVSALSLKLAMVKRHAGGQPALRDEIDALETLARKIDNDLDFLVWELRPTALDDLGLREALADYVESWSRHFGIPATFTAEVTARVKPEIETVVYRIAQEGLNNISKHAHAREVTASLACNGEVVFTLVDDGLGFDPAQPFGSGEKGLGLVGMRERAALVGGTVDIQSSPGSGTTIVVRLPVAPGIRGPRGTGKRKGGTK